MTQYEQYSHKIETIEAQEAHELLAGATKKMFSRQPRVLWNEMSSSYEPNGVMHSARMLELISMIHKKLSPVIEVRERISHPLAPVDFVPPVASETEPEYKVPPPW